MEFVGNKDCFESSFAEFLELKLYNTNIIIIMR